MNGNSQTEFEIKSALEFLQSASFFADIANKEYRDEKFMKAIVGQYANLLTNIADIREALDKTIADAYEWIDSPAVKSKIKYMAEAEYNAGGSDRAIETIDSMNSDELKEWLKELAKKDVELGVKIIVNGGK